MTGAGAWLGALWGIHQADPVTDSTLVKVGDYDVIWLLQILPETQKLSTCSASLRLNSSMATTLMPLRQAYPVSTRLAAFSSSHHPVGSALSVP